MIRHWPLRSMDCSVSGLISHGGQRLSGGTNRRVASTSSILSYPVGGRYLKIPRKSSMLLEMRMSAPVLQTRNNTFLNPTNWPSVVMNHRGTICACVASGRGLPCPTGKGLISILSYLCCVSSWLLAVETKQCVAHVSRCPSSTLSPKMILLMQTLGGSSPPADIPVLNSARACSAAPPVL